MTKYKHKKQSKTNPGKRYVLLLLLGVAILVSGYASLRYFNNKSNVNSSPSNVDSNGDYLNLNPPTEEEKQQADNNKKALSKDENENSNNTNTNNSSAVVIISRLGTYEGQVEAAGYVQNVFEDGGKCLYTFTNGSSKLTREVDAFRDVTTTICSGVEIPISEFANKGKWQLTISYKSSLYEGSSTQQDIEVQ
ncbi:hypothetical protein KDA00_00220 [Candidatus Saccharibacteria bacterium]|nr:hypothetical protein [Candidatus Saccharibacteria bacterium]